MFLRCVWWTGIGVGKKEYLRLEMGEGSMLMMERIKTALDSKNILNPGKVLDVRDIMIHDSAPAEKWTAHGIVWKKRNLSYFPRIAIHSNAMHIRSEHLVSIISSSRTLDKTGWGGEGIWCVSLGHLSIQFLRSLLSEKCTPLLFDKMGFHMGWKKKTRVAK